MNYTANLHSSVESFSNLLAVDLHWYMAFVTKWYSWSLLELEMFMTERCKGKLQCTLKVRGVEGEN